MQVYLAKGARMPQKGSLASAGYDIRAISRGVVPAPKLWMCIAFFVAYFGGWQIAIALGALFWFRDSNTATLVSTGIYLVNLDPNTCIKIAPRSEWALRYGIDVCPLIIDADYRGQIKVLLFNHGWTDVHFEAGDRIAQLVITTIVHPSIEIFHHATKSACRTIKVGSTAPHN